MNLKDLKPVDLFDYDNLEKSYRDLLKKYHPDIGGKQEDFLHIQQCYEIAKKEKQDGYAIGTKSIKMFRPGDVITTTYFETEYKTKHDFSYGKVYDGDNYTIYEFESSVYEKMNYAGGDCLPFYFHDDKMLEKIKPQLPIKNYDISKKSDRYFIYFKKADGFMLLQDIIPHKIPLQTSIWMFNRLYALGCYMQMTGIYNFDISPYTVSFNLESHLAQLLGGWWYSVKPGQKMNKLPLTTYKLLTNKMKDTKKATIEIVSEQIKSVMRTILAGCDIPKPYENWLSLPAQDNIINEYYQWEHEVMKKIFPVREFYKWTI